MTDVPFGEPLPPMTDQQITEAARGIVTGELLIADADDDRWRNAMALIISLAWAEGMPPNVAQMLVPVASHRSMPWQGDVPALVTRTIVVPEESADAVKTLALRMYDTLYPDNPRAFPDEPR